MEPLVRDKIIILFSLLFASIFAALIPLVVARAKWVKKLISVKKIMIIMDLAQGFGGGVLLGGGLLHLMAESSHEISEILEKLEASEAIIKYPWAPLLTCTALGVIFFVEIILTAIVRAIHDRPKKHVQVDAIAGEKEPLAVHSQPYYDSHKQEEDEAHGHSHGDISFNDLHGKSKGAALITAIVLWISLSTHVRF
jgi:hypothetical protein